MDVRLPDGTVIKGVPDGMSKQDLTNKLVANGYGKSLSSAEDVAAADPAASMSGMEQFRAGWGKRIADWGRGLQQVAPSIATAAAPGAAMLKQPAGLQAEIDESKRLDAPLMDTAAGVAGNIAGTAITAMPMLAVPGANTLVGAGALGAGQGAIEPVQTGGSRAVHAGLGAGGGFAGQAIGNKLAQVAGNRVANLSAAQSANATRDATLASSQAAGYVVPPSATGGSFLGNRMESIAGKAALGQDASSRNQAVTNALSRKALGLPENAAITPAALEGIRKTEGQAYAKVAALSNDAADALENLKQARFDANANFTHYQRTADPTALAKANRAKADAGLWEKFLEAEANSAGRADLIPGLKEARTRIAKTYDVERALNTSTGDVSAKSLGRAVDRGKPLSGELETAGRFADAFPRYAADNAPAPGVSKIEAGLAALLGTTTGNPLLAALPLASAPMRSALLSGPGQRMLTAPSYAPGILNGLMGNPATAQALSLMAPQLGLLGAPTLYATGR